MSIFQLVYISEVFSDLSLHDIDDILKVSRKNNEMNGITGCLVYYKQKFLQILEGEERAVRQLFEVIKVDRRHSLTTELYAQNTEKRSFSLWAMGYYIHTDNAENVNHIEEEDFIKNFTNFSNLADRSSHAQQVFWDSVKTLLEDKE